jgi:hypothetical protein
MKVETEEQYHHLQVNMADLEIIDRKLKIKFLKLKIADNRNHHNLTKLIKINPFANLETILRRNKNYFKIKTESHSNLNLNQNLIYAIKMININLKLKPRRRALRRK